MDASKIKKVLLKICLFLFLVSGFSLFAEEETTLFEANKKIEKEWSVDKNYVLHLENLAGAVFIEEASDNVLVCQVVCRAFAKEEKRAQELLEKLNVDLQEGKDKVSVNVHYPVEDHPFYYYPAYGAFDQKGGFSGKGPAKCRVNYDQKEVHVMHEPSLAAITLFADIHLKVPKNGVLVLKNEVGNIELVQVASSATIENTTGVVELKKTSGKAYFTARNSHVRLSEVEGLIEGVSAAGKIEAKKCQGKFLITTASGPISFEECVGKSFDIRSGSGAIVVEKTSGEFQLRSGSGKVQLVECQAEGVLKVETGSGNVRLNGDFSKLSSLFINTGSGDVTFSSLPFPELFFDARTASGEVEVKVPAMQQVGATGHAFEGSIKKEALGKAIIRSGSGDIKLEMPKQKQTRKKQK
jgi:DUF4097 and DUF4098 domain-containing protein YvlB